MGIHRVIPIASLILFAVVVKAGAVRRQQPVRDVFRADVLVPQRLLAHDPEFPLDVSADGRMALVLKSDEDPARLMIRDLVTNEVTDLKAGPLGWRVQRSVPAAVFSRDGNQIAYNWYEAAESREGVRPNLRVMDRGNSPASRRLTADGIVPHDWSRDLQRILVLIHGNLTAPTHFAWVSAVDGAIRRIKTLEAWQSNTDTGLRLSPDGRFIAYSTRARKGSADQHLYMIDADGQQERAVVTMNGSNTDPVWMPDSAHLLFVNTQAGKRQLYAVATRIGQRLPAPVKLQSNFAGEPVRVSTAGDLFYRIWDQGVWQLVADRGPAGARITQAFPGRNGTWSRGNRLSFVDAGLVIRAPETNQESRYDRVLNSPPKWFSDESGFIGYVTAGGDGGREGGSFYRVDARTGEFTWLFARHTENHVRSTFGALSPDDKTFYLATRAKQGAVSWSRIVAIDLATGSERLVVQLERDGLATAPALALSPNGSTLAIRAETGPLMTVGVDGSGFRELGGSSPGFTHPGGRLAEGSPFMQWTPDGASILFAASSPSGGWRIMRVPAVGGEATFDGLESSTLDGSVSVRRDLHTLINFDLSADGRRIAVSARATNPAFDLWKLPNVVSLIRTR
jgi:Tol biopolymer transport system component